MSMVADARPPVYRPRDCSDTWGEPKTGFRTRREAQHVRRVRRVMDQYPYQCPYCMCWHLGHRA